MTNETNIPVEEEDIESFVERITPKPFSPESTPNDITQRIWYEYRWGTKREDVVQQLKAGLGVTHEEAQALVKKADHEMRLMVRGQRRQDARAIIKGSLILMLIGIAAIIVNVLAFAANIYTDRSLFTNISMIALLSISAGFAYLFRAAVRWLFA